jgi:Heterokaryon incompatibility protein (HET)
MPLWIDQICINQSDIDEKSYLIGKMSLIYSNAESFLIWLAEENAQLGLAIQVITFMSNLGCNERHSVDTHALLRHLSQAFDANEAFHAMETFFALPWFSRL